MYTLKGFIDFLTTNEDLNKEYTDVTKLYEAITNASKQYTSNSIDLSEFDFNNQEDLCILADQISKMCDNDFDKSVELMLELGLCDDIL